MTFIVGFVMLGCGMLLLFVASPRNGEQTPFMKRERAQISVMLVVIVLILGGLGMLMGSIANLVAPDFSVS